MSINKHKVRIRVRFRKPIKLGPRSTRKIPTDCTYWYIIMPSTAPNRYRHGSGVDRAGIPRVNEPNGSHPPSAPAAGTVENLAASSIQPESLYLDAPYDLVCIGFGPASLAIAIALRERASPPRVLFLERQPRFAWHSGMLLPGTRMQISFIKDLATFRNPRSEFTFLNYLHRNGRLVSFTNLGTFLPLRDEYNDYMSWCASHFVDQVRYEQEAFSISPVSSDGPTELFQILTRPTSARSAFDPPIRTKSVVIAVGGRPSFPASIMPHLPHPRLLHSSQYSHQIPVLLPNAGAVYNIAVVGGGQSSAEIFADLHARFPHARTALVIRAHALRPSDDSPFVNEIFDPSRVDALFALAAPVRAAAIADDRATNYSVVRPALLEELYYRLYSQRVREPDEALWQHRVLPLCEVVGVGAGVGAGARVRLRMRNVRTGQEVLGDDEYDAVVFGTGYVRDVHKAMLKPLEELMDGECVVGRDYGVLFKEGAMAKGSGVYLQGCCEGTHGVSIPGTFEAEMS